MAANCGRKITRAGQSDCGVYFKTNAVLGIDIGGSFFIMTTINKKPNSS